MFFENFIIVRSYMTVLFHFLKSWIHRHKKNEIVIVITTLCILRNAVQLKPIWLFFYELKKQLWAWNKLFRIICRNFLKTCWYAFCDERKTMNVLNNCQLIEWFCLTIFLELWNVFFSFRGRQRYAANTRNVLADWLILSVQQWQRHWQLIESCFRFVNGDEYSLDKTGYLIASKIY